MACERPRDDRGAKALQVRNSPAENRSRIDEALRARTIFLPPPAPPESQPRVSAVFGARPGRALQRPPECPGRRPTAIRYKNSKPRCSLPQARSAPDKRRTRCRDTGHLKISSSPSTPAVATFGSATAWKQRFISRFPRACFHSFKLLHHPSSDQLSDPDYNDNWRKSPAVHIPAVCPRVC